MNKIAIIAKRDLREIIQSKGIYFGLAILPIIYIPLIIAFGDLIKQIDDGDMAIAASKVPLATLAITLSFMSMMTFCMILSGYSVLMEKIKRSMESLLATPLTTRQIWVGKAIAIFVPSVVLGMVLTIGAIVAANVIYVLPKTDRFVAPPASSLVVCLISIPAIVFSLVCVITILQFVLSNARVVNALFMGIIFGVGFGLTGTSIDLTSWKFTLISVAFIAVLAVFTLLLSRLMSTERIVLTSKG